MNQLSKFPVSILKAGYDDPKFKSRLLFFFPGLLFIGLTARFIIRSSIFFNNPSLDPSKLPILNSSSYLNTYLAGSSFQLFTSSIVLISLFVLFFKNPGSGLEYDDGEDTESGGLLPLTTHDLSYRRDSNATSTTGANQQPLQLSHSQSQSQSARVVGNKDKFNVFQRFLHNNPKAQIVLKQAIKLIITFTWIYALMLWFFGDSLFDRFLKYTGVAIV
ncbi:unnamed protein product [Ambrosiozyma monospora]|uniref:Unnamed protein product n=1 Tax=Ambrosiozyma monospora TaxID=43982 RepID=A0A9W7DI01_AMBMO|nr:unnamed protein product [Ambrosiozyma monospora]